MRAKPNRRKLTELFVRRVKPQPKKFLTWDTQQHGLVLVVEPTGHRSWKCVYRQHSGPRWYHIADASAIGLAEARKLAGTLMYQVAQGADPQAEKVAHRSKGTFEELATRYYEEYAKKHNKAWQQSDRLIRALCKVPSLENHNLASGYACCCRTNKIVRRPRAMAGGLPAGRIDPPQI